MYYYIGPFDWVDDEVLGGFWRMPELAVGMLELSTREDDAAKPGAPRLRSFFASPVALGSEHIELATSGDLRELQVTELMRDAWESATGYRPAGDTLLAILIDHLTLGADPEGIDTCPPLQPTVDGVLEIQLGGHSRIWSRKMTREDPYLPKYLECVKRKLAGVREQALEGQLVSAATGLVDDKYHQRILDRVLEDLERIGVDDAELVVPDDWKLKDEPPLKHGTQINDTFNRGSQTGLGTASDGFTYTNINNSGTMDINGSNQAEQHDSTLTTGYRADSDLVTDNNYGQVTVVSRGAAGAGSNCGAFCRVNSSGTITGYIGVVRDPNNSQAQLYRMSDAAGGSGAGSFTQIGSTVAASISLPQPIRCSANGSTINVDWDGANVISQTNTVVTAGLRGGFRLGGAGATKRVIDNFQAGDINGTATGALTIGHATASGSGTFTKPTYTATGALTIGHATASGSATFSASSETYTASGALTCGATVTSGAATFTKPTYSATGAETIGPVVASGAVTFTAPTYSATGTETIGPVVASGTATFIAPTYSAAGTEVIGPVVASGTGTFEKPQYTASGGVSCAGTTCAGSGIFAANVFAASAVLVVGEATLSGAAEFDTPGYSASAILVVPAALLEGFQFDTSHVVKRIEIGMRSSRTEVSMRTSRTVIE